MWGRSSPPLRAPNRARIRGAIDGGTIKLIKQVRSIWFHRNWHFCGVRLYQPHAVAFAWFPFRRTGSYSRY